MGFLDALGQGLGLAVTRQKHPARWAVSVDLGRAQIIGQRRAQCLFVAGRDLHRIEDLPALGGVTLQ